MGSEKGLVRDGKRSNRAKQKKGQRLDERRINRSSVRMLRMLPRRDDFCSLRAARKDRTSRSKRCTYFFPLVGREGFRSDRGFSNHSRHRVRGERDRRRQREEERGRRRSEKRAAIPKLQERSRGDDGGGTREEGLREALDEEESRGREFHKKRRGKKSEGREERGERRGQRRGRGAAFDFRSICCCWVSFLGANSKEQGSGGSSRIATAGDSDMPRARRRRRRGGRGLTFFLCLFFVSHFPFFSARRSRTCLSSFFFAALLSPRCPASSSSLPSVSFFVLFFVSPE